MRVLFVLHAPDSGGTERQLCALLGGLDREAVEPHLALLFSGGDFAGRFAALDGVVPHRLTGRDRWSRAALPGALARLVALARRLRPDVVCAMLPVANEMAIIAGRLCGARVVTGVRRSAMSAAANGAGSPTPSPADRAEAFFSRWSDLVVANSNAGRDHAVRSGYGPDRVRVIPNGVDCTLFAPDPEAGLAQRAAWDIGPDEIVVGQCGRLDPMKDFPTFLRAAKILSGLRPGVRFVCMGRGGARELAALRGLADSLGLGDAVLWPGYVDAMPGAYNALDLLCLGSAHGEGFPNALGEAMACGVPCVTTDVGDAALVLNDTGPVAPPGDPEALARAMAAVLAEGPEALAERGARCRERIVAAYSLDRMARTFEAQFACLTREGRPCAA